MIREGGRGRGEKVWGRGKRAGAEKETALCGEKQKRGGGGSDGERRRGLREMAV